MKLRYSFKFAGALAVGALSIANVANANVVSINGSVGGAATGAQYVNFDNLASGAQNSQTGTGPNGSVSVVLTPNAQVAVGALSGRYAAPYISGSNGSGFGSQTAEGADTTPYLTSGRTGDGGAIRINFPTDQKYFGLLWGSVDNYNSLSFYDSNNALVGTVTGSDVVGSPTGNQGKNGTLYVNIVADPFRYVVASSTEYAFEFDNVAYSDKPLHVPDGGVSLSMLGVAVAGLRAIKRFVV